MQSGPVCAAGYEELRRRGVRPDVVVVLGHFQPFPCVYSVGHMCSWVHWRFLILIFDSSR